MIKLSEEQYEQLVDYSVSRLPKEACGLLAGTIHGSDAGLDAFVEKIYFITNTAASPVHFRMLPKEQFEAAKDMRRNGLVLLGNFHSHPNSPAVPSEEDRRFAFDSKIRYTILSLTDMAPVFRSFLINGRGVTEEEVQLL